MKNLLIAIALCATFPATAQVGIGTTTPHSSAALDITSSNKGFLAPRVELTATNAAGPVSSPADGLIVYNTATAGISPNNVTPGLYVWNTASNIWERMVTAKTIGQNNKLGLDLTVSANPQKVYHDIIWYQAGVGTITPSQVPWHCENVAKANLMAAVWVQKLANEFKSLENDVHYDQLHNSMIVNSSLLGKIVLGRTALPTTGVDVDNNSSNSNYYSEYFTLIVGSNDNNELYTLEFIIGMVWYGNSPADAYNFRMTYQTNAAASDGHLANSTINSMPSAAPQCKTRASFTVSGAGSPAVMAYPVSFELNF